MRSQPGPLFWLAFSVARPGGSAGVRAGRSEDSLKLFLDRGAARVPCFLTLADAIGLHPVPKTPS